jgi:hypothetical protein
VVVVPTAAQLAASAARKAAANAAKTNKLINTVSIIADGVKDLASNSLDFFMGALTAVVDNQSHGLINRRVINGQSANDKDAYNQGQDFGDGVLNPLIGLFEIQTGVSLGMGGIVAAPESGGLSLSATAAGAGMVTQGITSIKNGYQNLSDQKGRVYTKSNSNSNPTKAKREYVKDYSTKNTKDLSAYFKSEREARNLARTKLGKNPVEVGPNKWRSADGKWQYRAKPGDLKDNHIHIEELNPETGEVLQNYHLRWK